MGSGRYHHANTLGCGLLSLYVLTEEPVSDKGLG